MTENDFKCNDGRTGRVESPSSMGGYGLILGYGGLRFNVYVTGFSNYQYLTPKSYSASFAIAF